MASKHTIVQRKHKNACQRVQLWQHQHRHRGEEEVECDIVALFPIHNLVYKIIERRNGKKRFRGGRRGD